MTTLTGPTDTIEAYAGIGVPETRGARASNAAGRREIILKTSKGNMLLPLGVLIALNTYLGSTSETLPVPRSSFSPKGRVSLTEEPSEA